MPNTRNQQHAELLVTKNILNTKISEIENNIPDNSKHMTAQEYKILATENFAARLNQAESVNRPDFGNKLTRFLRRITSNKTKHLEIQKKINSPVKKIIIFSQVELILQVMMNLKTHLSINQHLIDQN